jgi:hypothetical protein
MLLRNVCLCMLIWDLKRFVISTWSTCLKLDVLVRCIFLHKAEFLYFDLFPTPLAYHLSPAPHLQSRLLKSPRGSGHCCRGSAWPTKSRWSCPESPRGTLSHSRLPNRVTQRKRIITQSKWVLLSQLCHSMSVADVYVIWISLERHNLFCWSINVL